MKYTMAKRMKRVFATLAGVALTGAAAFGIYAWHSALPEVARPDPASFAPALVQRGAVLIRSQQ
jgi:hypothetical protein